MDDRFWKIHLDRCPALRPWLERAARVAVRRDAMPASLTLGAVPGDRTVRQALEALFGTCREAGGRLVARLDGPLRERGRWLPLASLLGIEPPAENGSKASDRLTQAILRLKLLHPDELQLAERLRESEAMRRFCGSSASAERELSAMFHALAVLRDTTGGMTLSELGARCCNDSKALRTGRLRQTLEHLLRLRMDAQDEPDRDVLAEAGIVDNPLTTQATSFAPFAYRTSDDGEWFDWPCRLWLRGEAAMLPWQTVRGIAAVRFEQSCTEVVTSENAAPFLRLVERRTAAVYTGGYPNAAVKALLVRFSEAGATARHWGDTDLDGYRIAEQVGRCIPVRLETQSDAMPRNRLRPLDDAQRRRAKQYLAAHPGFLYGAEVCQALESGWLEQEQGIEP